MREFNKIFIVVFILLGQTAIAQNKNNYVAKFAALDSLKIGYGGDADAFINAYINNPKKTEEALSRYIHYKPYIDSVFKLYGVPSQAGLLVLAASGADVFYRDEEGNAGPWAMQYKVARMYGLKMNTYVDERNDIEKTSLITAKFLKELFLIYNSWSMSFAAYTTTTLTVNKYIRLAGNNFNYWEMYDSLPQAAKNIVPQFIAAVYIYNNYKQHNINPKPYRVLEYDTVTLKKWMSFDVLAPALRTTIPVLQTLNPIFKKGIIPLSAKPYSIKLPVRSKPWFGDIEGLEFEPYNTNPYVEEVPELADKNLPQPKNGGDVFTGGDTLYHVVAAGEGLGVIAQKYGVTVDNIRKWNDIKGYLIFPEQRLMIIREKGE